MHQAKITLSLSEAQWSLFTAQVEKGVLEKTFYIDLPDGPWVQFTYEGLRDQHGRSVGLGLDADGFWYHDNDAFSDVTIEIVEAHAPNAT